MALCIALIDIVVALWFYAVDEPMYTIGACLVGAIYLTTVQTLPDRARR